MCRRDTVSHWLVGVGIGAKCDEPQPAESSNFEGTSTPTCFFLQHLSDSASTSLPHRLAPGMQSKLINPAAELAAGAQPACTSYRVLGG
jgi:hypothetical protein